MDQTNVSRRAFLQTSAAIAATATLAAPATWANIPLNPKRTAVDQVELGRTGIKLSRLGVGTGSANGATQTAMGQDGFTKFIHYAFDQGITYIDSAKNYQTFGWIGDAIKDLPREKIFLQSKVWGIPEDTLATIDQFRKAYKTDYIDSLLVHCMTKTGWTDDHKRMMDGFSEAQDKKWIRAKGVSCHSLPALQESQTHPWPEVHLVRVNPEGKFMDANAQKDVTFGKGESPVQPVLDEIKAMAEKGRGVIGMKICGNGTFKDPEQRRRSIKFAMDNPHIHAVVIGMKSTAEIDENIKMINEALAG